MFRTQNSVTAPNFEPDILQVIEDTKILVYNRKLSEEFGLVK